MNTEKTDETASPQFPSGARQLYNRGTSDAKNGLRIHKFQQPHQKLFYYLHVTTLLPLKDSGRELYPVLKQFQPGSSQLFQLPGVSRFM